MHYQCFFIPLFFRGLQKTFGSKATHQPHKGWHFPQIPPPKKLFSFSIYLNILIGNVNIIRMSERTVKVKQATGNRQQATGNRQQATGNRQQATGNRQQATIHIF